MKTVILGASTNPARASYEAARRLYQNKIDFVPISIKKGELYGQPIQDMREKPSVEDVHTLTLYLGPQNQPEWYDYILSLKPKRIIFNPGTENEELRKMADEAGIITEYSCTLVLLSIGQYHV